MESKSLVQLLEEVKSGNVKAFLQLVRRVEELCPYSLVSTRQVWFGVDLVLIRNCTYILIDKREKRAYVLAPFHDTYTVLQLEIDPAKNEQELAESICLYLEELRGG